MFEVKDAFSETTRRVQRVFASAQSGEGLPALKQLLAGHVASAQIPDTPETFEVVG